jgi:hypothetical protein
VIMNTHAEYRRINLQLRIKIEELAALYRVNHLYICEHCTEPFDYENANNLQLAYLLDEMKARKAN